MLIHSISCLKKYKTESFNYFFILSKTRNACNLHNSICNTTKFDFNIQDNVVTKSVRKNLLNLIVFKI